MALIRYYKFNGSLLDSSGYGFDLGTAIGSPVYQSGILGQGITGSPNPYTPYWGAVASGARPNAVLGSDVYQADNPNGAFSITFWMKISNYNYSASVISLEGATGPWTTIEYYGGSPARLYFNYAEGIASVEAPENEWFFVHYYLNPDDHYFYLSVNNGTPVANGYALEVAYTTLRVGSFNAYSPFGAQIDDLRIYNHKLTPAEISQIYNLGDPSEIQTPNVTDWAIPIHQHRLNGSLSDNVGAVTATATFTNYKGSGLFSASSNAISLEVDNDSVETNNASFGGATLNNGSFSVAFWYEANGTSGATLYPQFLCGPINKTTSDLGYPYGVTTFEGYELVNGSGPGVTDPVGLTSLFGAYVYNHVVQRFTAYGINANNEFYVIGQVAAARQNADITGWSFTNGENATPCTSYVDEVRYYDRALTGLDALELFNDGVGTQQYGINATAVGPLAQYVATLGGNATAGAAASGTSNTISVTEPSASAGGGGGAVVRFTPILLPPPSAEGSGNGVTSTMANGLFATFAIESVDGSAFGQRNVSLSIPLVTVTVRPQINQPVHNYKFENSLRDSYSTTQLAEGPIPVIDTYGQFSQSSLGYISSSQFVPGLGSFAKTALADLAVNLPVIRGFSSGSTTWDNTAYTQRSYTFSLWLRWPYTNLGSNPPGGAPQLPSMTMIFESVQVYLPLAKNSVSPTYSISWTPTQPGGGLPVTLASGTIQPGPATFPYSYQVGGDWFLAVTYNHVSQIAKVVTGQSGALSIASPVSVAPSNYNYGAPGGAINIVGSGAVGARVGAFIDDLRVYNYALSDSEIGNIYNGGAGDIIPAQGFGVGGFSPITVYSIPGSAFTTYGGPLDTVNVTSLDGTADGTTTATTSGTLATITVISFDGIAQGNPFGPLTTVSVVPPAGSAYYTPSSFLPEILVKPLGGIARGAANITAGLLSVSASSPSASAVGSASLSAGLGTVTVYSVSGSGAGDAAVAGTLGPSESVLAAAGSGSGQGISSGSFGTVTISQPLGSAVASVTAIGAGVTVAVSSPTANATGYASATGASNTINVSALTASVIAPANTGGSLDTIQVQAFSGSPAIVVTNGNAVGPLGGGPGFPLFNGTAIRLDSSQPPLGGVAFGGTGKFISAPLNTVIVTPLNGSGVGNVVNVVANSQPFSDIAATSQQGSGTGSSLGGGNFGLSPLAVQVTIGGGSPSSSAYLFQPLDTISVQSHSGAGSGGGSAGATLGVVTVLAAIGTAAGTASASASNASVTVQGLLGQAAASISTTGALVTVVLYPASFGSAQASATGLPSGAQVFILPALGKATSGAAGPGGRASVHTFDLTALGT